MLDWIEARAAAILAGVDGSRFQHSVTANDGHAASMLEARGLRPIRHYWQMQIDLPGPVDPGPPPDGVDIAAPTDDDLRAVHAVIVAAFADDPGDDPEPFERWADEHVSSASLRPRAVAPRARWRGGGRCADRQCGRGARVGRLARGRAVAAWPGDRTVALLRRTFAAFADRGIRRVVLNVDAENVTGATAVYERAGMRVANRWDLWERRSPPVDA